MFKTLKGCVLEQKHGFKSFEEEFLSAFPQMGIFNFIQKTKMKKSQMLKIHV